MSYSVKRLTDDEIANIYKTYMKRDFPPSELKPLSHILKSMEKGYGFSLGIYGEEGLVGYAVFILCQETKCALLDYFAILKERRGGGLGHAAFLLCALFSGKHVGNRRALYRVGAGFGGGR